MNIRNEEKGEPIITRKIQGWKGGKGGNYHDGGKKKEREETKEEGKSGNEQEGEKNKEQ